MISPFIKSLAHALKHGYAISRHVSDAVQHNANPNSTWWHVIEPAADVRLDDFFGLKVYVGNGHLVPLGFFERFYLWHAARDKIFKVKAIQEHNNKERNNPYLFP